MNDRQRRLWTAVATVVLTSVIVSVIAPPEALRAGGTAGVRLFATFFAAALVGVAVSPALLGRSMMRRPLWIAAACLALVAGISAYLGSTAMQRACTARYDGRSVLVGTMLTPVGAAYVEGNLGLSNDDLLFDAAGVAARVWTEASIGRCRAVLGGTYFLWIPCLAWCLFACSQAVPSGLIPIAVARPAAASTPDGPALPVMPVLYDVFISYRHGGHDAEFARELLANLERRGYRVAIDERDFPANASFLQEMERCIRQSRFTVAILSSRYFLSGHCEEEAIVCKVLDMGDRRRRLVPLLIEPVTMPAWLFGIVGINWTEADPLVDPFERLLSTLGPPLPAPAGR